MPVVGRYFPSQKSGEKIFLLLRRHWFSYVAFLLIGLIMSIPLIVFIIYWILNEQNFTSLVLNLSILITSAYFLFILGLLFYGFIDYYLDVYIVTNERIVDIEQNGFFRRKIAELHLHQIQDVNAQVNGAFATLLHYGNIYIQTAGERENFIFRAVPNPYRISKIIVDLHEKALEAGLEEEEENISADIVSKKKENGVSRLGDLNIDSSIAQTARKRTKDFLDGGKLVETGLGDEISQEINQQGYEDILDQMDQDKINAKNMPIQEPNKDEEIKQVVKAEGKTKTSPESKIAKKNDESNQDNDKSGELHENEEIDI